LYVPDHEEKKRRKRTELNRKHVHNPKKKKKGGHARVFGKRGRTNRQPELERGEGVRSALLCQTR